MALKMRQSLAQLEQDFRHETIRDRQRREHLRKRAIHRSRVRRSERINKKGTVRFWILVLSLIATAVIVTVAMFATLYYVLG